MGPWGYVLAKARAGAEALATVLYEGRPTYHAIILARPDLAIARFPQFTAPTLVTRREDLIREFHAAHGDIILKPLDGMGGSGIFRVTADGMNLGSVIEVLTDNGARQRIKLGFIAGKFFDGFGKGLEEICVFRKTGNLGAVPAFD
jgi:hypothetical protein